MKHQYRYHPLFSALIAAGLCGMSGMALATGVTAPTTSSSISVGEVSSTTGALNTLAHLPTKKQVFNSTQSVKVINRRQMATAGPAGGAAQALAVAPGINVVTDGPSGAPRSSISINGMKTGWGNIAGNANDGTVMVTFDGVPMVDPAYGVWQGSELPQMSMIKGITATYGPGYPLNRWYNNIGGSINFSPLQPTRKAGASIGMYYGSFDSKGIHFNVRTGEHDGWSGIIAGGVGSSGNYLNGYGFNNPGNNYAYYGKVRKSFRGGHISFGGYVARSVAYRPLPIPVTANPNVTIYGVDPNTGAVNPGPIYSQQTTGFYTTLPYSVYWKEAFVKTYLIYSRFEQHLTPSMVIHNLLWYRYGDRVHLHYNNTGNAANVLNQYYNASDHTYGDKLYLTVNAPYNNISLGGYFLNSKYNSLLYFYNQNQIATYDSLSPNAGNNVIINGSPVYNSPSLPSAFHSSYLYMTDLAAFVQDVIHPIHGLRITPGIRVVQFQTNFVNNSAAQFPTSVANLIGHNGDYQPNSSTNFTEFEPSIGVNYKVTPNVALYGNYATGYKAPAGATGTYAHELTSTLQPQKSTQYQIGVKAYVKSYGLLHHAVFNANYYHLNDTNEIIPIPVVNHLYSRFASGSSVFSGVNLSMDDNPLYNLYLFSNVSFEKATYSNYTTGHGVSYAGLPISNVPAQTANIGAYYQIYNSGILYEPRVWWQYTGVQNIYNNNTGAPTSQKLPSFGIFNASLRVKVSKRYLFAGMHDASVNVTVLNLLNKQYNNYEYISGGGYYGVAGQILGEPGMPRAVYLSVNASF
ncbi:MAG: TonB-dependent receptor [Acidithiobacillus ferrooxidans]